MLFVEGKWCYNAILNFGETSSIFDYDTKSKTVVHKDKDGNDIECEYAYFPQSFKIVAGFVKNRMVVIQDEMLTHWHRGWFAGHVQHSVLGRVKSDLIMRDDVVVLNKRVPSTKFCPHCGKLNSLSLKDRVYRCDCGAEDTHLRSEEQLKRPS